MATIKLAFFKADTIYGSMKSRLISKWTKSPYSHVELIIEKDIVLNHKPEIKPLLATTYKKVCSYEKLYDPNLKEEDFNFLQFTSSPDYGGVCLTYHKINNIEYDYLEFEVNNIEWIIDFFYSIRYSKYDNVGILGFLLPFKDRTNEWFCSESCSNALKIIGFKPMWLIEPSSVSPGMLFNMVSAYIEGNENVIKN